MPNTKTSRTRPAAKKARAAKSTAARKARPGAKKARAVKKTAARKARPATKKAKAAKKRVVKATKSAPATKAVKKTVKKAAKKTVRKARVAKKTAKKTVKKAARKAGSPTATRSPATKRSRSGGSTDAIALLKQDHREVARLFAQFKRAGDGATRTKERLVAEITTALSQHAAIEELVFYPAIRREVKGVTDDVLEALEEHHVVKFLLRELEGLDATDERFDAKTTVMIENVEHHVKEEEEDLFPKVRKRLGRARLADIGDELKAAKSRVPTRPHPFAPDEPPGNVIVGGAVAVIDRARTAGKKVVDRVRDELPTP